MKGMWKWPNVHPVEVKPIGVAIDPPPEPRPIGRAKVKCPVAVRGWRIIPAADVKPSDVIMARYPE